MMMYEADEAKREAWMASIDAVAALNPKIVVAGHKSVGAADLPQNLEASQRYLRDFTTLAKKGGTVEDLVHGMLELHGERDQQHTLWISARAEVADRQEPHNVRIWRVRCACDGGRGGPRSGDRVAVARLLGLMSI
jgi:hypothetical protein